MVTARVPESDTDLHLLHDHCRDAAFLELAIVGASEVTPQALSLVVC